MAIHLFEEIPSLIFMAIALGLDTFSVSLGLGMKWLRLKRIAFIGFVFGLYHMLLPLIGMVIGHVLSSKIGGLTSFFGALLLIVIGLQMFFNAFRIDHQKTFQPIGLGLLLLSLSVSVDSFSVGLSLGLTGVQTVLAIIWFGTVSMVLAWLGMIIGRKVTGFLGAYSELFGGSILITFGLRLLFGS